MPSRYEDVDIVIVRENTEGLYAGIEHYIDPRRSAAESIAIITEYGSERVSRFAFEYAVRKGRKRVTCVHKANILKMSNGLFLDTFRKISKEFPSIEADDMIVDANGRPANFMDIRTTATSFDIARGVELLLKDSRVRALLLNVHGGGMTVCDTVAEGVAFAYLRSERKLPCIARLAGVNADWGNQILQDRRCRWTSSTT